MRKESMVHEAQVAADLPVAAFVEMEVVTKITQPIYAGVKGSIGQAIDAMIDDYRKDNPEGKVFSIRLEMSLEQQ